MQHEHTEKLGDVFINVLETFAFMFADAVEHDELPAECNDTLRVAIGFKGPLSGELILLAHNDVCRELASNVLGIDEDELDDDTTERTIDAIKELLNVICGQMLTAIAGTEPVFDLTMPTVTRVATEQWHEMMQQEDALAFLIDEVPLLLKLELEQAQASAA